MTAWKKKGRTVHTIKVPTRNGEWKQRTTSTRSAATAKAMQRMVDELAEIRPLGVDILQRVADKVLGVAELYDRWIRTGRDIALVSAQLEDVDLEPYVDEWYKSIIGGVSKDTADHYKHHVYTLFIEGAAFFRSSFNPERLQEWIDTLESASGTRRKAAAGMSSFAIWLKRRKIIDSSPMRDVKLPKPGKPRMHFLEQLEAKRLADAQPGQFKSLSALLAGTGSDVTPALKIRKRDVDVKNKEIRSVGTKAHNRDRIIRVADWVFDEYVLPLLAGKLPDALLFDEIPTRWAARYQHFTATEELAKTAPIFKGYTMRDARHTYAVRAIRAGTPAELVARQLGHANAVLVHKVYGRFAPTQHERDRWEKIASAQDVERAKEAGR